MASGELGTVVKQFQKVFDEGTVAGLSESQLLDRFLTRRDETAFEALVIRHGPMVLAVCRSVLRDPHAAEDAFQATFLVLARKASTVRDGRLLGAWLHRVARRVALRARLEQHRRSQHEKPASETLAETPAPAGPDEDLRSLIHEEVDRLPERYRAAVVLCDLEGWTHEEAAGRLHWPVGSVKGRLFRARGLLRHRLTRRGVTLAAASAALASTFASHARASVPSRTLVENTVLAAHHFAAGKSGVAGLASASAAVVLAEGVLGNMTLTKLKIAAATSMMVALLALGATALARSQSGPDASAPPTAPAAPAPPQQEGDSKAVAKPRTRTETEKTAGQNPPAAEAPKNEQPDQPATEDTEDFVGQILDRLARQQLEAERLEIEVQVLKEALGGTIAQRESLRRESARLTRDQFGEERIRMLENTAKSVEDVQERLIAADAELRQKRRALDTVAKPGDTLMIEILEALPGRPLRGERVVRADGSVSLDYYGELQVAGLTPRQIKTELIRHLQRFLSDDVLGVYTIDVSTGKEIPIPPADSDRAFVDFGPTNRVPYRKDQSPEFRELMQIKKQLDQVLDELTKLKSQH